MNDIEVLFKEYEAVRQEILNGLSGRNTMLSIGLAAIGGIVTAAVAFGEQYAGATNLVLVLVVPPLSCCILLLWFGEYRRVQNAGIFLYQLESRINGLAKSRNGWLTFETETRHRRQRKKGPFLDPTVTLFAIIGFASLIFGLATWQIHILWKYLLWRILTSCVMIVSIVINCSISDLRKRT